jgi:hypothetical protein
VSYAVRDMVRTITEMTKTIEQVFLQVPSVTAVQQNAQAKFCKLSFLFFEIDARVGKFFLNSPKGGRFPLNAFINIFI